jgi:Ca2+:H+ antiporter
MNFTLMAIALIALGLPVILLATGSDGAQSSVGFLMPTLAVLLIVIYSSAVLFSLRGQPTEDDALDSGPAWSPGKGLLVLAAATGAMIVISDVLVGSVEGFIEETGISQVFVGLILIPIFSNVVDHIVAITVAIKNRMDLSLTISVGSAAQISCLVIPTVMLIAIAMGQSTGLIFAPAELVSMAVGLLMIVPVLLDGRSNWLEGAQLLTVYLILATVFWVL